MSIATAKPATTPIPVHLAENEFPAFILPHLSMPKRRPQCKLGYHRVFNLILWILYTPSLLVFPSLWYTTHCILELSGAIHDLLLSYLLTTLKMSNSLLMEASAVSPMSKKYRRGT